MKHYKESKNKFGSSCPKKLLALSKEYSPQGMCTASKKYQDIKLKDLEAVKSEITQKQFESEKQKITDKACLCVGLVNSAYLEQGIEMKGEKQGVVVCPGPNLAYFDKEVSLSEMIQHIYGNVNILPETERPNMFINELKMYVDHLKNEISDFTGELTNSQIKKWKIFKSNLFEGIDYYKELFEKTSFFSIQKNQIKNQLEGFEINLHKIAIPELQK